MAGTVKLVPIPVHKSLRIKHLHISLWQSIICRENFHNRMILNRVAGEGRLTSRLLILQKMEMAVDRG
jgi:hypothetical protein